MATNEPLVPSMIFRSRTTYASSNVTEQNACSRSFSLLSSMSLIRTSVITTAVLLFSCGALKAAPDHVNAGDQFLPRQRHDFAGHALGVVVAAAEDEQGRSTTAHQMTRSA